MHYELYYQMAFELLMLAYLCLSLYGGLLIRGDKWCCAMQGRLKQAKCHDQSQAARLCRISIETIAPMTMTKSPQTHAITI
jgi:hypothetical protein